LFVGCRKDDDALFFSALPNGRGRCDKNERSNKELRNFLKIELEVENILIYFEITL